MTLFVHDDDVLRQLDYLGRQNVTIVTRLNSLIDLQTEANGYLKNIQTYTDNIDSGINNVITGMNTKLTVLDFTLAGFITEFNTVLVPLVGEIATAVSASAITNASTATSCGAISISTAATVTELATIIPSLAAVKVNTDSIRTDTTSIRNLTNSTNLRVRMDLVPDLKAVNTHLIDGFHLDGSTAVSPYLLAIKDATETVAHTASTSIGDDYLRTHSV